MARLDGKVAIITGGARGMGEATARVFVEQGAKVVIGDVLEKEGTAVADELGDSVAFVRMDVTSETDWQTAIARAQQFGPLNVLVNNAAILYFNSIADTSAEDYIRVVTVNQVGTFLGIRNVIAPMKAAGGGSIINISSIDGLQSKNGLIAYSSTKWGVRGLTKSAAIELGKDNIRINSVHPGGILTAMHGDGDEAQADAFYRLMPIPRAGRAHEVARMTAFLASDEASYSTGSEFIVDGGWNAGLRQEILPGF